MGYTPLQKKPHDLARENEELLKKQLISKFSLTTEEVKLLLDEEDGVYWSEENPELLCCLAVGTQDGFLYLVTGEVDAKDMSLKNLQCDIVA